MTDFAATEAAIRQLHARYIDAIWRKDAAALGQCFTHDAEWHLAAGPRQGRSDIVRFISGSFARFRRILMTFGTPILQVADKVASGRTYVSEDGVFADGTPYRLIGIYFERFADEGDCWRFTWRQFQSYYSGRADYSGEWPDVPDCGPPPEMPQLQ